MKHDPWALYCEAYRECFPTPGAKIELSPAALATFYDKAIAALPEGGTQADAERIIDGIIDNGRFGKEADELRAFMNSGLT